MVPLARVRAVARCAMVCLVGMAVAAGPKSKVSQPMTRIPLADVGVPGISEKFLASGASVLTLNILDDKHLLVTFSSRKLIPRIPGDPSTDQDRIVSAEVLELPAGKVVARTDWHLHDQARYLWPLGHGRFVIRIGDRLSLLDPMATLHEAEPLGRMAMPHQRGLPIGVTASPDGELVSVVTELPVPRSERQVELGDHDAETVRPSAYAIDFFRIAGEGTAASPLKFSGAGVVKATFPLVLPMDTDGYLWAVDDGTKSWAVSFNDFNGTVIDAGRVDSSCPPRMKMVSRSQYVALTCRMNETQPKLQAMGLDGHEVWEENLSSLVESPAFVYAPKAGRFAASLTTTNVGGATPGSGLGADASSTAQELRVYQTESGDLLLKLSCAPIFRVPENFDLSEDGRMLAVIRGDAIETYALPAPSKRDMEDLAEVEKFRPPVSLAPVTLSRMTTPEKRVATTDVAEQAAITAPVSTTTEADKTPSPVREGAATGDKGVRRRPTLLNPGEVAEFKDKSAVPQ